MELVKFSESDGVKEMLTAFSRNPGAEMLNDNGESVKIYIVICIALVQASYEERGRKFTGNVYDILFLTLQNLDPVKALAAVRACILESPAEPPRAGEIAQRHAELIAPAPGYVEAWGEVETRLMRRNPGTFSHPLIRDAVRDMGGMDGLYHSYRYADKPSSKSVMRAQFRDVYESKRIAARNAIMHTISERGIPDARELYSDLFLPNGAEYQPFRAIGNAMPETAREYIAIQEKAEVRREREREQENREKGVPPPPEIKAMLDSIFGRKAPSGELETIGGRTVEQDREFRLKKKRLEKELQEGRKMPVAP